MEKEISFEYAHRQYYIEFNNPIIQIIEVTSRGLKHFIHDFLKVRRYNPKFRNSLVIDKFMYNGIELIDKYIKTERFKFDIVIIKDAGNLISDKRCKVIKDYVAKHPNTLWILIGNCYFDCIPSMTNMANMTRTKINGIKFYSLKYIKPENLDYDFLKYGNRDDYAVIGEGEDGDIDEPLGYDFLDNGFSEDSNEDGVIGEID